MAIFLDRCHVIPAFKAIVFLFLVGVCFSCNFERNRMDSALEVSHNLEKDTNSVPITLEYLPVEIQAEILKVAIETPNSSDNCRSLPLVSPRFKQLCATTVANINLENEVLTRLDVDCFSSYKRLSLTFNKCTWPYEYTVGMMRSIFSCSTIEEVNLIHCLSSQSGQSIIHAVALYGNEKLKKYIYSQVELNMFDKDQSAPVAKAALANNLYMVKLFLAQEADIHTKVGIGGLIHWAAINGHLDIVQLCIEKGVDIGLVDDNKHTPVYLATVGNHSEIIQLLIEKGVHPCIRVVDGLLLFHWAVREGCVAIVEQCINKGVPIDICHNMRFALDYAVENNRSEMVKLLLEKGADPNPILAGGLLHWAVREGYIAFVKQCIGKGAN